LATIGLALIAAGGVILFAWGANPPQDVTGKLPVVVRTPTAVQLQLTKGGQDRLKDTLGTKCVDKTISAVAVEDLDSGAWRVAVVRSDDCNAALIDVHPKDGTVTLPPTT
jgi:hypothetical protein